MFDVGSLMDALMRLHDQRDARRVRYAFSTVLVFVLLVKLCGEDSRRGIAQWVKERAHTLAELLGLAKAQAPHHTPYGRLLARAVDAEEFEQVRHDFFTALPQAGQTVQMALDGKTLRGTIPTGATQGVHLLTAYFPDEGWVFAQVAVGAHENEIAAAPRCQLSIIKLSNVAGRSESGAARACTAGASGDQQCGVRFVGAVRVYECGGGAAAFCRTPAKGGATDFTLLMPTLHQP